LPSGTTPIAGTLLREGSGAWSWLTEAVLLVVAIGALLPRFSLLAAHETGRDGRFAEDVITVRGLPDPVLPKLCAGLGADAEAMVRDHLCGQTDATGRSGSVDRIPPALANASVQATKAFLAPLQEAQTRLADLRRQLREGQDNLLVLDDAIESTEAEIQPFIKRYSIARANEEGPLPLSCAYERVEAALAEARAPAGTGSEIPRANAVILLGAALDGHRLVASLASVAALPSARTPLRSACAGVEIAAALSATATLMDGARTASMRIRKNEAMIGLLRSAGWQWAAWAVAGFLLLTLSRRAGVATIGVAFALVIWAAAAWIGRVPWPFVAGHSLLLARESPYALAMPANFVLWMLGAAIVVVGCTPWLSKALASGPQNAASAFAYPGLVFASGIGFLLVLDLSANGQPANRYLALYHQGHLWFGMLAFTVVAFVRQPLGRSLSWVLSLFDGLASNLGKRVGAKSAAIVLLVLMLALVGALGFLLPNSPQLTSEIGRLWLIVGAAWFFFMRGTPFTERLARSGSSLASLFRYVWPLLFVVIVLIGAMAVTHDMGPLLIAGYAAGAFVAASMAMWLYQRLGTIGLAYAVAVALFVGWILATTVALFQFGSLDEVAAERLENLAAPLSSANDQLALVTWFQRAAPPEGFGTGAVPWCGFGAGAACAGVPAQIQSDYTFTAMVGAFGWTAAWALTIGCAVWLHALIRSHGQATRGEPRFVRIGGRIGNDHQAFLSWLCVAWAVLALCQLAVTVAGNLAVIPLTGVTFPFVSFGLTSLAVNMAMLGLAINLNAHDQGANG
jgi:cell division protein FtsW (lipid II flippase)